MGESILDRELVPVARAAFLDADDLPPDDEVLQVLDREGMDLLGEGYHIMTLAEPAHRFVVKYAKNLEGIPPLAPPHVPLLPECTPRRDPGQYKVTIFCTPI